MPHVLSQYVCCEIGTSGYTGYTQARFHGLYIF
jgi:hypothetical protein